MDGEHSMHDAATIVRPNSARAVHAIRNAAQLPSLRVHRKSGTSPHHSHGLTSPMRATSPTRHDAALLSSRAASSHVHIDDATVLSYQASLLSRPLVTAAPIPHDGETLTAYRTRDLLKSQHRRVGSAHVRGLLDATTAGIAKAVLEWQMSAREHVAGGRRAGMAETDAQSAAEHASPRGRSGADSATGSTRGDSRLSAAAPATRARPASAAAGTRSGPAQDTTSILSGGAGTAAQRYMYRRAEEVIAARNASEMERALSEWRISKNAMDAEIENRIQARRRMPSASLARGIASSHGVAMMPTPGAEDAAPRFRSLDLSSSDEEDEPPPRPATASGLLMRAREREDKLRSELESSDGSDGEVARVVSRPPAPAAPLLITGGHSSAAGARTQGRTSLLAWWTARPTSATPAGGASPLRPGSHALTDTAAGGSMRSAGPGEWRPPVRPGEAYVASYTRPRTAIGELQPLSAPTDVLADVTRLRARMHEESKVELERLAAHGYSPAFMDTATRALMSSVIQRPDPVITPLATARPASAAGKGKRGSSTPAGKRPATAKPSSAAAVAATAARYVPPPALDVWSAGGAAPTLAFPANPVLAADRLAKARESALGGGKKKKKGTAGKKKKK